MLRSRSTFVQALAGLVCANLGFASGMQTRSETSDVQDTYDFIIVGGGTAGMVLANRLTESANTTVLVIEPGSTPTVIKGYSAPSSQNQVSGERRDMSDVYDFVLTGSALGTQIDWGFTTVPQTALDGRQLTYNSPYP